MIVQIVKLRADPSNGAELERLMRQCHELVVAGEPGTLAFHLVQCPGEPGAYKAIDLFQDEAALDAHASDPAFKPVVAAVHELLLEPPATERLSAVY